MVPINFDFYSAAVRPICMPNPFVYVGEKDDEEEDGKEGATKVMLHLETVQSLNYKSTFTGNIFYLLRCNLKLYPI